MSTPLNNTRTDYRTPPQAEVLASALLTAGFNCLLQMPTGSGKTWLAEQAITSVLANGQRAIYLTPLRALATELVDRWQQRFAPAAVGVFTGDYGVAGNPYPVPFSDAQLLVMTPERLDACTRAWRAHWSWIPEVDLLVVDELHLLGEARRGARLEGTISRMRRLNPFLRVLGLSATLGNRYELADWLDGVEYRSSWRPIPLQWRIIRYRKADEKPGLLANVVAQTVAAGGKSLVFVQSRRRAEVLSRVLRDAGLRAGHHHAGLGQRDRRAIEYGFRGDAIDVLVATATLEMGVNLPVRQVILYDLQSFDGTDFRPLSTNSVWQRVGRAGRPGLDPQGEAVLFAAAWEPHPEHYMHGEFEPIRSGFTDQRALAEQIVVEIASGLARSPHQLKAIFAHSLAAQQQTLPNVEALIAAMVRAGMITQGADEIDDRVTWSLKATRLGRIVVRHLLAPATILLFRNTFNTHPTLTFLDLLIIAACSDDCEPLLPVDFEELDELAAGLVREPSTLLLLPRNEMAAVFGVSGKRLLAALKMALVARNWARGLDAPSIAEQYDCYPFEVERLVESMERLTLAMAAMFEKQTLPEQAAALYDTETVSLRERVRTLQAMISAGLDEVAITLTLVDGIGPRMARRLQAIEIAHLEDLALVEASELAAIPGLSQERATRWIAEARELIRSRSARRYEEFGPKVDLALPGWSAEIDPYRLRRALDLHVTGSDGGRFRVIGGLDPHQVTIEHGTLTCDCVDADRGHQCKHTLAVRLHRGDRSLHALARQLSIRPDDAGLNLFDLWFDGRPSGTRRRVS